VHLDDHGVDDLAQAGGRRGAALLELPEQRDGAAPAGPRGRPARDERRGDRAGGRRAARRQPEPACTPAEERRWEAEDARGRAEWLPAPWEVAMGGGGEWWRSGGSEETAGQGRGAAGGRWMGAAAGGGGRVWMGSWGGGGCGWSGRK
jgi:hypothetical protein